MIEFFFGYACDCVNIDCCIGASDKALKIRVYLVTERGEEREKIR